MTTKQTLAEGAPMKAEVEAIVSEIKGSLQLLRRHL